MKTQTPFATFIVELRPAGPGVYAFAGDVMPAELREALLKAAGAILDAAARVDNRIEVTEPVRTPIPIDLSSIE